MTITSPSHSLITSVQALILSLSYHREPTLMPFSSLRDHLELCLLPGVFFTFPCLQDWFLVSSPLLVIEIITGPNAQGIPRTYLPQIVVRGGLYDEIWAILLVNSLRGHWELVWTISLVLNILLFYYKIIAFSFFEIR